MLPANRRTHKTHTDKLAGSSSSVCSCCCSCCSCFVCVWHTLMTHTSCCTRVATLADAATTTIRGCCCYCCWLHIFLVIKITLKQQAEAGEGAMNERQTLPLRRGNKLVDWRMHVYECMGVRIALCVCVSVYVCVCLL